VFFLVIFEVKVGILWSQFIITITFVYFCAYLCFMIGGCCLIFMYSFLVVLVFVYKCGLVIDLVKLHFWGSVLAYVYVCRFSVLM